MSGYDGNEPAFSGSEKVEIKSVEEEK
jgi:hypothetical protein